jgi:hypothetical protein
MLSMAMERRSGRTEARGFFQAGSFLRSYRPGPTEESNQLSNSVRSPAVMRK